MRLAVAALLLLVACPAPSPPEPERAPGAWTKAQLRTLQSLRLDATPRPSPSNRWADHEPAARLGQALFHDPGLSPSGSVSCATCHVPEHGFSDPARLSEGVGTTARHAPAIPGSQYGAWLYWDGRVDSLWAQANGPIEHPDEMGSDRTFVARQVATRHAEAYERAFGEAPPDLSALPPHARPGASGSPERAAWEAMTEAQREAVMTVYVRTLKAIAAHERELVPTESPFDRYVDALAAGDPTGGGHLTDGQIRGLDLFIGEAGCTDCHNGPLLTDRAFHNLGLPLQDGFDGGRAVGAAEVLESEFSCRSPWSDTDDCPELDYLDPTFPDFQQAFKTPSLRNVAKTPPYMHHGGLADLTEVLTFYSELPGDPAANHRELTLQRLDLDEAQKRDLIAFLTSLTGDPLPAGLVGPPQNNPADGVPDE